LTIKITQIAAFIDIESFKPLKPNIITLRWGKSLGATNSKTGDSGGNRQD